MRYNENSVRIGNALYFPGPSGLTNVLHPANTEDEAEIEQMYVYSLLDSFGNYDIQSTTKGIYDGSFVMEHTTDLPWKIFINN